MLLMTLTHSDSTKHQLFNKIKGSPEKRHRDRFVCELMGWVRNVVLIKCIFGSGKPRGGWDFGWEGTRAR